MNLRTAMRWLMALFYLAAGVLHLTATDAFVLIVPAWVPSPRAVVIGTGVCEVAGAIGLVLPSTMRFAGVMLALYAVCVFPANIKHAFDQIGVPGLPSSWWYHGPRLMAQPLLIWWALYASKVVEWPFGRPR